MERLGDRIAWTAIGMLLLVMTVFVGIRLVIDVPNVASGRLPDPDLFERRYAEFPILAYGHIIPGVVFLLIAPFQLSRSFRNRNLERHRVLGRIALVSGVVSGLFAIVFGFFLSFGGTVQAAAAVLFGLWFIAAFALAYRAIRRRDIAAHRRWMIRAFAVGLAVGTIRLWIGLFEAFGVMGFREAFGVAFWLSFVIHALIAELWLLWRPGASGAVRMRLRSARRDA